MCVCVCACVRACARAYVRACVVVVVVLVGGFSPPIVNRLYVWIELKYNNRCETKYCLRLRIHLQGISQVCGHRRHPEISTMVDWTLNASFHTFPFRVT